MFITALTSVHQMSLSWASPMQSIYPHPTAWRFILILSTHLRLGLPCGLLPSGFPSKYNSNLLTYLLLLEKLTGLQLAKKFPAFHGTRKFITALTTVRHLSLSWTSPIQSIYPYPTPWRSILILSTHLRLGLPSSLLPSGFPTRTNKHPCTPSGGIRTHDLSMRAAENLRFRRRCYWDWHNASLSKLICLFFVHTMSPVT